jgi:hypothetical protein
MARRLLVSRVDDEAREDHNMDMHEQLRRWGAVHAQARDAEQQAASRGGGTFGELEQQARRLREEADRLHRTIYGELGNRPR